jgi:hypothetical protein
VLVPPNNRESEALRLLGASRVSKRDYERILDGFSERAGQQREDWLLAVVIDLVCDPVPDAKPLRAKSLSARVKDAQRLLVKYEWPSLQDALWSVAGLIALGGDPRGLH